MATFEAPLQFSSFTASQTSSLVQNGQVLITIYERCRYTSQMMYGGHYGQYTAIPFSNYCEWQVLPNGPKYRGSRSDLDQWKDSQLIANGGGSWYTPAGTTQYQQE